MGKIIWICSSWKTRSNSVKEVGLKKVNERYLSVISFVLFIETKGSPPRTTQCQSLVKERKIILFLKQLQGYGSSKPIFILFYSFVLLFFFNSHITRYFGFTAWTEFCCSAMFTFWIDGLAAAQKVNECMRSFKSVKATEISSLLEYRNKIKGKIYIVSHMNSVM